MALILDALTVPIASNDTSTPLGTIADVFTSAILGNAAGVIVCHNPPGGDPTPSPEDLILFRGTRPPGAAEKLA